MKGSSVFQMPFQYQALYDSFRVPVYIQASTVLQRAFLFFFLDSRAFLLFHELVKKTAFSPKF